MTARGGHDALFLIDGFNFLFRAYHALPPLNAPDGTPVQAVHGFVRMVQALRREHAPQYFAAIFDAGGTSFRNDLYPAYKANRPAPPEDLVPQFDLVRAAVDALGIARVERPGFEADDLIATFAERARAQGMRVTIVSSDKDLMQLVDDGDGEGRGSVCLLDTMKQRVFDAAAVKEKWGVGPEKLGDLLALTGDSSDNIPGVPGIGPKTAAALLEEYGDLEGVLRAAPTIKQKARRERLVEHADTARLSRRLVALAGDLPVDEDVFDLADHGADAAAAESFFTALGFKSIVRELAGSLRGGDGAAGGGRPVAAARKAGPVELSALSGADAAGLGDAPSVALITDGPGLTALLATLDARPQVAVELALDRDDPMRARVLGAALWGTAHDGADEALAYVPLQPAQADADDLARALWRWLEARSAGLAMDDGKSQRLALARQVLGAGERADEAGAAAQGAALAAALAGSLALAAGPDLDVRLASYALDPARSSHELPALASELAGVTLPDRASLTASTSGKAGGRGRAGAAVAMDAVAPELVGAWAGRRAQLCGRVGEALRGELARAAEDARRLYADVERPLAAVLARLEARGIALDVPEIQRQSQQLGGEIETLQSRVEHEVGHPVNLDSPKQLQELLFVERGLPPGRKTKTGFSTDAQVLEELAMLDPIIRDILEYRQLTKLKGTYLDPLPELVHPHTGRVHTRFQQAVAATGRLSSVDPNLQNIPIRTEQGRRIREAFIAPAGRVLVAYDYSQIELRVLAHLSGDPNLCGAFRDGVDVHRRTAAEVFGVPEAEVTGDQRRIAKAVNFGVVYGQTAFGLAQQLGIPRGKAGSYIRAYFERIPGVEAYMSTLVADAKRKGYAETILGRKRRIPELARKGPSAAHGERMARNTPIQGSAADIMKLAMLAVERALDGAAWAMMLLTVHDELIFECDEGRVDELTALVKPAMEGAFALSVPLEVDVGQGPTWAAAKG